MIKNIPNTLTVIRVIGSVMLLFTEPFSSLFFTLYITCGASDILDGFIARKTKNTSKAGAILDSVADFIFISIMLFILIPIVDLSFWMRLWLIGIIILRAASLLAGFIRYRSLAFLHTYMNKITGALLFGFPLLYRSFGLTITAFFLCSIASISAAEELIINITSKKLSHNIKSLFLR